MKKLYVWLAVIMILEVLGFTQLDVSADEYFDIRNYDVNIKVLPNNNYEITETIVVDFYSKRHGITRNIDREYKGIRHDIRDVKVTDGEGNALNTRLSIDRDMFKIKIGSRWSRVSELQTYKISYVYVGNEDYNAGYDEFYFNIIGTEWNAYIDEVHFTVEMPKAFDAEHIAITTGEKNSTSNEHVAYRVEDHVIIGDTHEMLWTEEGITLAMVLPEGYYEDTEPWINQNRVVILFGIMAVVLCGIVAFYFKENNVKRIKMVLTGQPPEEINCAEMAYIYKGESIQPQDIAALILQWASEGYLEVHKKVRRGTNREDTQFVKIKNLNQDKPDYEHKLFYNFFKYGDGHQVYQSQLSQNFYEDLGKARQAIEDYYTEDKDILEDEIEGNVILGVIVMIPLMIGILTAFALDVYAMRFWGGLWHSTLLVGGVTIAIILGHMIYRQKNSYTKLVYGGLLTLTIIITGAILFVKNRNYIYAIWNYYPIIFLLILATVIFYAIGLVFLFSVKHYTPYGLKMMGQIMGFKAYIDEAHADDIKKRNVSEPSYIHTLMPFAMVFGLSKVWDKLLNHVTEGEGSSPYWYHGSGRFNSINFMEYMQDTMRNVCSEPVVGSGSGSDYSGGGSSSGGSVGGGAGGGGGDSW